jgi:hypothetical protein
MLPQGKPQGERGDQNGSSGRSFLVIVLQFVEILRTLKAHRELADRVVILPVRYLRDGAKIYLDRGDHRF